MTRNELIQALEGIFGRENVLWRPADLLAYEYDATIFRGLPGVVVQPTRAEQLVEMVKLANRVGVPYVARGAGTGLAGGAVPPEGGIVVAFSKMNRILEIDAPSRRAVVEPGVVNLQLKNALAPLGLTYAPDPSSQKVSTMGGNIANNAGGPFCLKYGVTTNHVVGLEVVLPSGKLVQVGGKAPDGPGYDLVGLFVGAEGTLGLVTKITVRLTALPEAHKTMTAAFPKLRDGAQAVSDIIGRGIVPAALEMMDRPAIQVTENAIKIGLPTDVDCLLLIELQGAPDGMDRQTQEIVGICQANRASEVKVAQTEADREKLWVARRNAFGAVAKLRPNCYVADGTVPRTKLPDVLEQVYAIADKYGLTLASMFHAGDGNLHPNIVFDARDPVETERVFKASTEMLRVCIDAGGTITGEHGVGIEKREDMTLLFDAVHLEAMARIKRAFDPLTLCNPHKMFPSVVRGV